MKLTEKQDKELLKARDVFKEAVEKIGLNPEEWDLYYKTQIKGNKVEVELEEATQEHKEVEEDLALSLKELIDKPKDININMRKSEDQELPYSEIVINRSAQIAGCRSNTATLKEVEAVVLNLGKHGLIEGSESRYIG